MLLLNWHRNPFLQVRPRPDLPGAPLQYFSVCREYHLNRLDVMVEVYFTEPVSLFDADEFNEVTAFGRGSSRKEGWSFIGGGGGGREIEFK